MNTIYLRQLVAQALEMKLTTREQMRAEATAGKKVFDLSTPEKVRLYKWLEKLFGNIYTMFDSHKSRRVVGGVTAVAAANYLLHNRKTYAAVWSSHPLPSMGGTLSGSEIYAAAYKDGNFLAYDMPRNTMRPTAIAPAMHKDDADDADDTSFSFLKGAKRKSPALSSLPAGFDERVRDLLNGCAISDTLLNALSHGLVRQNTNLEFVAVRQAFGRVAESMKKAEVVYDAVKATVHDEILCEDEGCDHYGTPHVCNVPFRDWVVKRGGEQPPASRQKNAVQKLWGEKE